MRYSELEPGSIADKILNLDDSNDDIIDPNLSIEEISKFKDSKRG